MQGTVLAGSNNFFEVECDDGITRSCSIKGKVLKSDTEYYNPLAPGDIVEIEADSIDEEKGQVVSLVPRKNEFVRWNVKGRCPQLLAANVDYMILVTTPAEPPFRPRFIDRELAQAEMLGLTPVIVCNKYDLIGTDDTIDVDKYLSIWEQLGYKVMRISAKTGEGVAEFAELLEDHLSALVGQSGVGKSSLVNVLDDTCVLKTGSLSKKYGRGSHTTTKGTLNRIRLNVSLTGGIKGRVASIIDTPGIRRFMLHGIEAEDLALYFKEFKPFLGQCTFGMSCSHTHENGCRIRQAVEDGEITAERYDSWLRIMEQIKNKTWED
ncbi:ribosome small subunit-dependent GTPase A [Treponema porcinum]|uniref:ribosome small subunit-dependent GTPase A n=3 Tax=Treponema porcinum TaxID=261392 RepID=UPI0023568C14|nr:ribosome small subunit-dependent GTPase A [Treponema porcinum]MCI6179071.1 ribosome small subunit-dependent GTPase A [Treponema porcinum]MCI6323108.1 ribosome small subunit-dependent GTPase A [Treponema porcinum]MCI6481824.1 ribosome small subunit-dependent GTPase A [Treponema porcinum]MCI6816418.1 ribosome small subunit-dependent GTPase A [Treponema porcinum]MCI6984168.1 ribosome small subunit-dependent GTPase A [Treponema porcinum]